MAVSVREKVAFWTDWPAGCCVTTIDAVGRERVYEVGLSPDHELDDGRLLEGKRVDEDAPDEPAGGGVPSAVFDAAREHFRDRGFEVHGE